MTRLMALGLQWSGDQLFTPRAESEVAARLLASFADNIGELKGQVTTSRRVQFLGEQARKVKDPADPRTAGWAVLYNSGDPHREALLDALKPLTELRGAVAPLEFHGEHPDRWFEWLTENYQSRLLESGSPPRYILIVGGPDQVPFAFQSFLHSVASVGRVSFDSLDDLRTYADKVARLEQLSEPVVEREAVCFAPDGGLHDPTHFSCEYMVSPLVEHLRDELKFAVRSMSSHDATKARLSAALGERKPAIVYTASHGLGATDRELDFQRRYNGAICCQHHGPLTLDALFSADDVPAGGTFLEGAVFFQFACYGYGTPALSDYEHWLSGAPRSNASADFVAALPKKLLAHPRGPIAFIGHLDTAFLHAFTDENNPFLAQRWHKRIAPFVSAVTRLLELDPTGLSMQDMRDRFAATNVILTNIYDTFARQSTGPTIDGQRLIDAWIMRGDAQNYMVMGDPAVRLRIPAP